MPWQKRWTDREWDEKVRTKTAWREPRAPQVTPTWRDEDAQAVTANTRLRDAAAAARARGDHATADRLLDEYQRAEQQRLQRVVTALNRR